MANDPLGPEIRLTGQRAPTPPHHLAAPRPMPLIARFHTAKPRADLPGPHAFDLARAIPGAQPDRRRPRRAVLLRSRKIMAFEACGFLTPGVDLIYP